MKLYGKTRTQRLIRRRSKGQSQRACAWPRILCRSLQGRDTRLRIFPQSFSQVTRFVCCLRSPFISVDEKRMLDAWRSLFEPSWLVMYRSCEIKRQIWLVMETWLQRHLSKLQGMEDGKKRVLWTSGGHSLHFRLSRRSRSMFRITFALWKTSSSWMMCVHTCHSWCGL